MDNALYFVFMMCLFSGWECILSNGTLVLSDRPCNQINDTNRTNIAYQPVTYAEVHENENEILSLSTDGDKLILADYGMMRTVNTIGCYKLNEQIDDKKGLNEIKARIRLTSAQPKQPFEYCIKHYYSYSGILSTTCGCVPLTEHEVETYPYLEEVNPAYCMANDISYNTGEIYMFVIYRDVNSDLFVPYLSSCRVLSRYIQIYCVTEWFSCRWDYFYSTCGIPTDGTLCAYETPGKYVNDTEHCKSVFEDQCGTGYHLKLCDSKNQSIKQCINKDTMCLDNGYVPDQIISEHYDCFRGFPDDSANIYSLNSKNIKLLYMFDEKLTENTVLLIRKSGRLFVEIDNRYSQANHLCRTISYVEHTEEQTLHLTLITVVVVLFILLVGTFVVVFIVKKRAHQNTDSNNSDTLDRNDATELQTISSTRGGGSRHSGSSRHSGGSTSSRSSRHSGSSTSSGSSRSGSSVSGSTHDDGAVPGRMPASSASQHATDGEVPGRTSRGYNPAYFRR